MGLVSDFNDTEELFYIQFQSPESDTAPVPEVPFNPTAAHGAKKRLATTRPGQAKFRFDVFKRYGSQCAFCNVDVQDLLEAAHIAAKQFDGCDDPRNGLVLCRNHHRALDKGLIVINPDTLSVEIHRTQSSSALGVTQTSIAHLRAMPAPEALRLSYKNDH